MGGIVTQMLGRNAAGAGSFNPATLSLNAWYDPSDLTTLYQSGTRGSPGTAVSADGDPVGLVLDKSGNNYDLSQSTSANRPTYKTSGGLSWLDFDGVNDYLDASGLPSLAQPNDIAMAVQWDTLTGVQHAIDGITARHAILKVSGISTVQLFAGSSSNDGTITAATPVALTARFNGSSSFVRLNRVQGSALNPSTSALQGLRVGCFAAGSAQLDGRIYGLMVRDTVFTSTELDNLEVWLGAKAGLSL